MGKNIIPPIKSQGIKTKLIPWINALIPERHRSRWIEPFMGTGVVAFNVKFNDHFYHSGGKIENRNSIVEALVFNFETSICEHNYEPIEKAVQFTLFNKDPKYNMAE